MKTRNQFVSNSSSSSFVIFGVETDYDELIRIFFNGNSVREAKTINGCEHEFDRTAYKFCGFCGKPATNTIAAGKYRDGDIVDKLMEYDLHMRAVPDIYGERIYFVGRTVDEYNYVKLCALKDIDKKCLDFFNRIPTIQIIKTE
jgi:hypothetical protein